MQITATEQAQNIRDLLKLVRYPEEDIQTAIEDITEQINRALLASRTENRVYETRKAVFKFIAEHCIGTYHTRTPGFMRSAKEFAEFLDSFADLVYWLDEAAQN